ncbi:MGMT family protein [Psychromonas sp. 14N.309.X.WAT.B.A12]|uniref:MGMT family protein n=1 Tax=unclassified Psychromonas TaxID=2614957 RepID=UPI0025B13EA5|nr:MGMT family protein [Psychromonas sp. 14N.309.X.WAT.B.A12]MDN2662501.1 MGMT family protein [Psychromonas sp. 14N.309.X.WAT.B.A12]
MDEFAQNIFTILSYLEKGKLTTYGQLASQAGFPAHSRHVGKILAKLPKDTRLPWYRVVNSQGKISLKGDAFIRQKALLEAEQIEINEQGKIIQFKQYL